LGAGQTASGIKGSSSLGTISNPLLECIPNLHAKSGQKKASRENANDLHPCPFTTVEDQDKGQSEQIWILLQPASYQQLAARPGLKHVFCRLA
jgi:hypothetical protein